MTPKARTALHLINCGLTIRVTRQMIDRLSAAGLVDFDLDAGGWTLTPAGHDALRRY